MVTWNANAYAQYSSEQQKWARELISKLKLVGHERLLDIGCGDGKITAEIAKHLSQGEAVGVDSSPGMIEYAQRTFPREQYPNLSFVIADASQLPFSNTFDVVFSNACLHWIWDHRPVLAGIRRALHTGGRAVLQMGGKGNAAEIMRFVQRIMQEPQWRAYFGDFSFRYGFHGVEEYRQWMAEAHLKPHRIELIPKAMQHEGPTGLSAWLRTTWMPYISPIPEDQRELFIGQIVREYVDQHPEDGQGKIVVAMVRLEVEAEAV